MNETIDHRQTQTWASCCSAVSIAPYAKASDCNA